jgi:ethanolamine utilization protein EutA (predicted chaperonin)
VAKTVEEIADAMFTMVKDAQGVKKLKPTDLTKAMAELFGDDVDKKTCKEAIKTLVNSGKCVYTYFGGSFLELPHREGAAND